MADNSLDLPGDFQPGKNYLMSGKTLREWKERLEADRALPGPGMTETATGKGRMFRVRFPPTEYPPYALREMTKDGTDYKLTFEPGRVIMANPVQAANLGDGYDYFVPEIGGIPMDEKVNGELPTLTVADGQGVYVQVNRDKLGMVIPPVQLVAQAQAVASDHYQPEDPVDPGQASEFDLVRILDLDVVSGEVEIKVWRESDIQLTPFLWTGLNVGGFTRVFKEYAEQEGVYKFRSLRGCWGIESEEDGDVIKFDFDAQNIGGGDTQTAGAGGTILVPKADEDPLADLCALPAKFKSLLQGAGADEKQIRITQGEEDVRIHGNGKKGALIFLSCAGMEAGRLEWEDGLITTNGNVEITVGDCTSGT